MTNGFGKMLEILLAVLLMILFPALYLHEQGVRKSFQISLEQMENLATVMQTEGFYSKSMAAQIRQLEMKLGGSSPMEITVCYLEGDSKTVLGEWLFVEGGEWYRGEQVWPFSTGGMLEIRCRCSFDGLERTYFLFCPGTKQEHSSLQYYVIRDGLRQRGVTEP